MDVSFWGAIIQPTTVPSSIAELGGEESYVGNMECQRARRRELSEAGCCEGGKEDNGACTVVSSSASAIWD